jgi:hypothetical protein
MAPPHCERLLDFGALCGLSAPWKPAQADASGTGAGTYEAEGRLTLCPLRFIYWNHVQLVQAEAGAGVVPVSRGRSLGDRPGWMPLPAPGDDRLCVP